MLHIDHLYKTFHPGTANENPVIRDLSLRLEEGDFVTVIGSNGAGKSTLLNLVSGGLFPDQGQIFLDDLELSNLPEHRRAAYLGHVYQDPLLGTAGDMTIYENLAMAAKRGQRRRLVWGLSTKELKRYRSLLSSLKLGLEDRMDHKVRLLSGGQRQALTLLMATMNQPQLLLLDEHSAALDPRTADTVLALTERIVLEMGLTTLMITHNMKDALRYGNRLIMMNAGQVIYDISGEEKRHASVEDLMKLFAQAAGSAGLSDRMLLQNR